jgi:hypothetical protein
MTDFLTRLAQRVLGLAPIVQPIVASVFEPTQAVAMDTFSFDIEQEYAAENQGEQRSSFSGREAGSAPPSSFGHDVSRPPASQEQRPAAMQAEQAHTNPRTYARYSQAASLRITQGSQEALTTQRASSPELSEGEVHGIRSRISAMGAQGEYRAMRSPTAQERNRSTSVDRLSLPAGQQNIPETRTRENHSNPLQSNAEAQSSTPHITVFASTETPPLTPTKPTPPKVMRPLATSPGKAPVGAQYIAPSRLAAPPLTHQPDVVPESPTIQVTIGRIEVRATLPPPTARPQQQHPTSSKMSLDEYLKQRSRGGK